MGRRRAAHGPHLCFSLSSSPSLSCLVLGSPSSLSCKGREKTTCSDGHYFQSLMPGELGEEQDTLGATHPGKEQQPGVTASEWQAVPEPYCPAFHSPPTRPQNLTTGEPSPGQAHGDRRS